MVLEIFEIVLPLRDRYVFMWKSEGILRAFNTLTLKRIFWKTKTFFKKLEYLFLAESSKIENVSFPYKTTISEIKVKTYRMVSKKWTYYKERRFASNYFIFFIIRISYKELIWRNNYANIHICTFRKSFFSGNILNKNFFVPRGF